ncbi:ABC transporter ATP-binding protein/permease|uniref:Putative ATP-binding cassette transporter n=1 Tax=Dendrosporobacter quercicolus TaxID=146817 RepID=A0A1G9TQR2_9FIRM|nr:ABC transporter ATP-binding protein/permease [Dendrosporobacter quercicolus]NSL48885.1 ABC transporter ATP-binding protein/permease [Dendrosporobacter quercicolus DSM 1736]SDM50023.1 putative ATP-binding cassette transporter [Dendrosporobacter quercicolus]
MLNFFRLAWKISRGFWKSEGKWYARLLAVTVIALQMLNVYVMVQYNMWQNQFYSTIQEMNSARFFHLFLYWPVFTLIFLVVDVNKLYLQQMLEVRWRTWLTNYYLQEWLSKRTYYLMQILDYGTDNPDQRISEDVRLFVSYLLELSFGLFRSTLTLASFIVVLWNLSGVVDLTVGPYEISIHGYMVWVAILYAVAGSWLTAVVGNSLIRLNFVQQRYEADFRFSLIRLRENGEGIAFYNGEHRERASFTKRFQFIIENFRDLMSGQRKLSYVTLLHWRLSFLLPYLISVPRIFEGKMQLGGLFQTATAFTQVEQSLSFFIDKFYSMNEASLAELQAVTQRLSSFAENIGSMHETAIRNSITISHTPGGLLGIAGLSVELPTGEVLLKNLELEVRAGDSLLITGASGSGKSTLMKTLAGIWPFGQGQIRIPEGESMLFLPQKPYLPLGTIREILAYPAASGFFTEQKLREIMAMCKLGEFMDRLDENGNWSQILSLGEQQRIAFGRAILHRPQWLFLDEATSALDEQTEMAMHRLLHEQLSGSTIISVGHRSTLLEYHDRILNITEAGSWKLSA